LQLLVSTWVYQLKEWMGMSGDKGDRPVGDTEDPIVAASRDASAMPQEDEENEVLRETRRLRDLRERAERAAGKVGWKTAAGIGIGSAALLAAALYANRKKD
jgi:hypothetical protein